MKNKQIFKILILLILFTCCKDRNTLNEDTKEECLKFLESMSNLIEKQLNGEIYLTTEDCNKFESLWYKKIIPHNVTINANIERFNSNIINTSLNDTCFLYEVNNISIPKSILRQVKQRIKKTKIKRHNGKVDVFFEEWLFQPVVQISSEFFPNEEKIYLDSSGYSVEITRFNQHLIKYKGYYKFEVSEKYQGFIYNMSLLIYIKSDE